MAKRDSRLVYSTEKGRIKETPSKRRIYDGDGIIRIRRETSGRKGKGVTTITGFDLTDAELKDLAKQLKRTCSTGGTVKNGIIEIQGDHRNRIQTELEKRGHQVKLAGG